MTNYTDMKSKLLESYKYDKQYFEIKGPNTEPGEWTSFKASPPTGNIDHFYIACVKGEAKQTVILDACMHEFTDGPVICTKENFVLLLKNSDEIYWKPAEKKEENQ